MRSIQHLKTPPSKERGVLSGPSTLPTCPACAGRLALVWVRPDFEADGLRHGAHPCFGARTAPHSPVGAPVHARPASATPNFPRGSHSGHMTGLIGLLRAWRPERPHRGPAARDLFHRDNDASAATTVFSRHSRSHDRTGSIWLFAWELRSGCRPGAAPVRLSISTN